MREKPLTPWVVAESAGKILAVHCDCVAGLGETCSHVASLLFAIESGVCIRDSMTVMQKKAYWVMPTGIKEVHHAPVKDINLVGKKGSAAILESLDFRPSPLTTQLPAYLLHPLWYHLHLLDLLWRLLLILFLANFHLLHPSTHKFFPLQDLVQFQFLLSHLLLGLLSHQHQFVKKHQVMMIQWASLVA